jgi:hypothetical protein
LDRLELYDRFKGISGALVAGEFCVVMPRFVVARLEHRLAIEARRRDRL